MFYVDLILPGSLQSVRVSANQVVLRQENGTPVFIAGTLGPGQLELAHANDEQFQQMLARYGVHEKVICRIADR